MICPKCGANEPHFCPPSMGEPGFYLCECERVPVTDEPTNAVLRPNELAALRDESDYGAGDCVPTDR